MARCQPLLPLAVAACYILTTEMGRIPGDKGLPLAGSVAAAVIVAEVHSALVAGGIRVWPCSQIHWEKVLLGALEEQPAIYVEAWHMVAVRGVAASVAAREIRRSEDTVHNSINVIQAALPGELLHVFE